MRTKGRRQTTDDGRQKAGLAGSALLIFCVLVSAFGQPAPAARLAVARVELSEATAQPLTGWWNPRTGEVSDERAKNFAVFCGPAWAITFATASNATYECHVTPDFIDWRPISAAVIGTGQPVTLYDTNTVLAFYRLKVQ